MKRASKQASPFGFVSVAEFAQITGYGESTVRNMVNEGLLGDALRSTDKPNGEIKINVWLALEARGMRAESIARLRQHLGLEAVPEAPLLAGTAGYTFTLVSGAPVQLVSFAPAVASR